MDWGGKERKPGERLSACLGGALLDDSDLAGTISYLRKAG